MVPVIPTACIEEHAAPAEDALSTFTRTPGAILRIGSGNEHFDDGYFTLTVRGDGTVKLENRNVGVVRTWDATWDATRLARFVDELRSAGFLTVNPPARPRVPGDVPLQLSIEGPVPYSRALWEGDRRDDPGVERILSAFEAVKREMAR